MKVTESLPPLGLRRDRFRDKTAYEELKRVLEDLRSRIREMQAGINDHYKGIYGEIYTYDNSTAQSIPPGATFTKLTGWTNNGLSCDSTPDYANGKITINSPGKHRLVASFSISSGTNNVVFDFTAFVNGVAQDNLLLRHKISVAGDTGNMIINGFIDLSAGDEVDIRARHDNASDVDLTVEYANFSLHFIGE